MTEKVKAYVWIQTNKIGSRCVAEIEVEADETDEEALIEIGKDTIWEMAEWGVSLEKPKDR
jgi:hypothetical protein